jgi:hypothetical protein
MGDLGGSGLLGCRRFLRCLLRLRQGFGRVTGVNGGQRLLRFGWNGGLLAAGIN